MSIYLPCMFTVMRKQGRKSLTNVFKVKVKVIETSMSMYAMHVYRHEKTSRAILTNVFKVKVKVMVMDTRIRRLYMPCIWLPPRAV